MFYGATFHVKIEYHDETWAKNVCWNAVVQYEKTPNSYLKPGNPNKMLFEKLHDPQVPIASIKSEGECL